jgi:DNA-binding response OmpR family regulator
MKALHAGQSDTASIRQAAQLPCPLMVVGDVPQLRSRRRELTLEGFDVVAVQTAAAARARQELTPCSIILAASELPPGDCDTLVSSIRAQSNVAYVYLISQVVDEHNAGQDVDDWVVASASFDELMSRLRAARRIVTLEHICRVENDTSRMRALVEQVCGTYSGQFLASEAARRLAELQRPDQSLALLLIRSMSPELGARQIAVIVESLFGAASDGMDVVARLTPVTFGLLLPGLDEHAAGAVQEYVTLQLSPERQHADVAADWSPLCCGVAAVHGPVVEPPQALRQLILSAEQRLQEIRHSTPSAHHEDMGT